MMVYIRFFFFVYVSYINYYLINDNVKVLCGDSQEGAGRTDY